MEFIYLRGCQTIHPWPPTSRCTCKQTPTIKPCNTRLFWIPPHSRIIATHHLPNFVFSSSRQFWCEIHRQGRFWSHHFRTKKHYEISEDWTWRLYFCIKLKWYYENTIQKQNVDISIPGYITKQLQKYQHEISKRPQHATYTSASNKYGEAAQEPIKTDDSKPELPEGINRVHKIVSRILYYARSVDPTILRTLSTLVSEQSKVTAQTIQNLHQILDDLGTHPYATIICYTSNMILNAHYGFS